MAAATKWRGVALWGPMILVFAFAPWMAAQQPPTSATGAPQTEEPSVSDKEQDRLALENYRHGDYEGALRVLGEVLRRSPENSEALNLQGLSYLRLENYPAAIEAFQHGLNAHPGDAYDIAGLLSAYSLSGKSFEAGEQRKKLQELQAAGHSPAKLSFIIEKFQVGDQHVQVIEFFPFTPDKFHYRYSFAVTQPSEPVYRITLESDDGDQAFLAKIDPQKATAMAAGGKRRYSLDKYTPQTHATFKFYDGEPSYEQVREDVTQAIKGTLRPVTTQTYKSTSPSPASPSQPSAPDSK